MAGRKLKREDQIGESYGERLDPTQIKNAEQEAGDEYGLSGRQQDALQDKLDRAEKQLPGATLDDNIDDVRQQEAALTSGLYTGSGRSEKKETVSLKTVFKKKGALGALIALGLGLPTLLTIMLSPALLLQQLAETMTGEFNDQLAALDARSTLLLKKKLNSTITKGMCGKKVTIKCKYQSIRENSGMAKRLKKAGIEIKGNKSIIPGRIKPASFVFEGKAIPASELLNEARKNPALRSALRKGYDPVYAAFSDKISTKVRGKLGIKRSSDVKASADREKMNDDLKKVASGELNLPDKKLTGPLTDEDGKEYYTDEDGNKYDKDEGRRINGLMDELADRSKVADSVKKATLKAGIRSALTVTAMGAGVIDTACTVWVTLRIASFAAKVYQQKQLIRYSYEFMKLSHKQKYGDLTAEEMAFFGDKLTSINSEGKGALDSSGFKFAAYGDTFSAGEFNATGVSDENSPDAEKEADRIALQNETSRFVNGQLITDNLMTTFVKLITGGSSNTVEKADSVCKFTKSWKGQALIFGAAILGAVVGFFSGGASIGWGAIASGTAMVAISVAFALIQPKLLDMVKGEVIKGDENGNETGNAIASGMGGYNTHTAPGRGLGVSTQEVHTEYANLTEQVLAKNAEIDRSERSPFDASSKNTFLGSIVSNLIPHTTKMATVGSGALATGSFISSSLASLGTKQVTYAAGEKDKYNKCDDHEYKGLAADPFCNLRYAIPKADLEIDPDDVLDFMLSKYDLVYDSDGNPVIDPDTGEQAKIYHWIESPSDATPKGDYATYVDRCFEREDSIGDPNSDEEDGYECVIGKGGGDEGRNKMFRLFYLDQSVGGDDGGMDNDFEGEDTGEKTGAAGDLNLTLASFNILHIGDDSPEVWKDRLDRSIRVINDNGIGVVGLQEAREGQQKELMKADKLGSTYEIYPKTVIQPGFSPNPIIWDTSKYTLQENGTQKFDIEYDNGGSISHGVQVKLRDNSTGTSFYVLNTHDPANVRPGSEETNAQSRSDNADTYIKRMKELSSEGIPIFLTGDFNSRYNAGPHCKISSSGTVKDSWEIYKNIKGCANTRPLGSQIDRIYMSPQGSVSKMWIAEQGRAKNGADHDTIIATINYTTGGGDSGEVAWPLDKKWWIDKRLDFLNSHGMSSGTFTSPYAKGIATDISSVPDGSPVYSMVAGKVTRSDACAIIVKSSVSGGTLDIAYGHTTDRISSGKEVTSGQQIGKLGNSHDGGCSSTGGHLHVDMSLYPGRETTGRHICPQDVFLALDRGSTVNWSGLTSKAKAPCGR